MHRIGVEDGGIGGRCLTQGWRHGVSAGEVLARGIRTECMDMSANKKSICVNKSGCSVAAFFFETEAERGDRSE